MNRCVIVGGADINDYTRIKSLISPDDYIICCDCGLRHLAMLDIRADLVIGDFDSHEPPDFTVETITLPREKDDTDTGYAVKEAMRRGYDNFLLTGVIGNRFDHSLGNISLLLMLHNKKKTAVIADDYSEISIVEGSAVVEPVFEYFSLVNIFGSAADVTITGAKFPLLHADIPAADTLGISNEPLPGRDVKITVGRGCLLLVKVIREDSW